MANLISKQSISWVDAKGFYAKTFFYTSTDTAADQESLLDAWGSAAQALSNCLLNGVVGHRGSLQQPAELGTALDYQPASAKANLVYVDADGALHRYQIPAPKRAIFLADGVTVDNANAEIVAFNTIMLNGAAAASFISSRQGQVLSTFVGGTLLKRKTPRRISIFTRNPTETGPDE